MTPSDMFSKVSVLHSNFTLCHTGRRGYHTSELQLNQKFQNTSKILSQHYCLESVAKTRYCKWKGGNIKSINVFNYVQKFSSNNDTKKNKDLLSNFASFQSDWSYFFKFRDKFKFGMKIKKRKKKRFSLEFCNFFRQEFLKSGIYY